MRTIIASEDPAVRDWVRMALGPRYQFVEAADGLEARRLAASENPALMIVDETMEHYGAFGLAREIKQGSANPPSVIVLLERAQDAWLASWAGVDRTFVRPVDAFALAEAASELTGATVTKGGIA